MRNAKSISSCLILALILLLAGGARAAVQVAPLSVTIGRVASVRAEFNRLFPNGDIDMNTRYTDITGVTFSAPGIAEAYEDNGVVFIRGLSEGIVGFTAISESAGALTGTLAVYALESQSGGVTFARGEKSIFIPKLLDLYTGQAYSFYADRASFAIESVDKSEPTHLRAVLGQNRERIYIRTRAPGEINLYVRDNLTGEVAMCKVIVSDLQFRADFDRDMKKPLRVGETVTPRGSFLPALTERQLKGARWISYNPDIASVDAKTGAITAHSPGIAGIFLYLPFTDRYYGLGIGHYDEARGQVVYGVLVE